MESEMEIWKKLKNYEDSHEVSNLGQIRTFDRVLKTKTGLRKYKGKLLALTFRKKDEYVKVCICNKGKETCEYLHRLVAQTFIDNSENKEQVNHINGNKRDNRVENLEWATQNENQLHACKNGLKPSKLTESDVLKIRNDKRTGSEIAKDYNIAFQTVSEIKNKKIWAWVS